MTEDEARHWVKERFSGRYDEIAAFLGMVVEENERQNLIAPSTLAQIWVRHAVDSLQLVELASSPDLWGDIGTGGGFPGMMVAIVRRAPIMMIEPRQKRAIFLRRAADRLNLSNVDIVQQRVETVMAKAAIISARAVGSLALLINLGIRLATPNTQWILPRGMISENDMAVARNRFGEMFHVEQSVTSPDSGIVLARGIPR